MSKDSSDRVLRIIFCLLGGAISGSFPGPAEAFDIVREGKAQTAIVIPEDPLPVVTSAAQELQYYVREASGATLPIIGESEKQEGKGYLFLGACQETGRAGIHPEQLPPNSFIIKLVDGSRAPDSSHFFLSGHDSAGEPFWVQHNNGTQVGTLFAVYEFLDRHLGVRWLWPGRLGEVVPPRPNIEVTEWDQTHIPQIIHSRWRDGGAYNAGTAGWSSPEVRAQYLQEQGKWLRRQRFARGVNMDITHAFTGWWERFGAPHPEYFNLLPDGTRRPDPYYWGGAPSLVSLCVSEPALWRQIIEDWKARRTPENPFIDASENDTNGKCTCDRCRSWDVPDPESEVPFTERLERARKAFAEGDSDWVRFLGSLSDRYARFYREVQKEAEKVDPQATVMGLAYANYWKPPLQTRLNERIIIAVVPAMMFPWTEKKRADFRTQWEGWRDAGVTLMLRPNYTLDGHNFPLFYARKLGSDFSFAVQRGLVATDFDSLTGQWATQGPNLYVLGRLHARPEESVDQVLEEYYRAFGPAEAAVREYFAHWEQVSDAVADEDYRQWGAHWARFYRAAHHLFTPDVMAQGKSLLEGAIVAAQGDPTAEKRVAFLIKGLKNVELTLAAQEAYEQYQQNGDLRGYRAALEALDTYRQRIERDYVANMGYLAWAESQTWDRSLLTLLEQPGKPLPGVWKFHWDSRDEGEDGGWFADGFDDTQWLDIGISSPWEEQEAGRRWKEEQGSDYNGLAWYRTHFTVRPSEEPQRVRLIFGAVDEACTVWVNGRRVLERPYPYQGNTDSWQEAFEIDVTEIVRTDRANTLAVRVEDNAGAGGIWKPVWLLQSAAPDAPALASSTAAAGPPEPSPVLASFDARLAFSEKLLPSIIAAAEEAAGRVIEHPAATIEVPYREQLPFGEEMNSRAGGLANVDDPGGGPVGPDDIALINVRAWDVDGPKILPVLERCRRNGWLVILFASKRGLPEGLEYDHFIDNGGGPGPEDSALNAIANIMNAWLWACEYTSALTRRGKYPGVLRSVCLPGSAEFNKPLQTPTGRHFLGDCGKAIPAGELAGLYLQRLGRLSADLHSATTQKQIATAADLIVARLQAGKRVGVSTLSHFMIGDIFLGYRSPWVPFTAAGQASTAFTENLRPGDLLVWLGYIGLSSPYEDYGKFIRESKADFIAIYVPDTNGANNAPDALWVIEEHWEIGDAEVPVPFPPGRMAPVSGIDQALIYRLLDEAVMARLAKSFTGKRSPGWGKRIRSGEGGKRRALLPRRIP